MSPVGMDDRQTAAVQQEHAAETFQSAEARYAYERARRLRLVLRVVGAAVAVVVFGAFMYWLGGGGRGGGGERGDDHDGHGHGDMMAPLDIDAAGSPDAAVKVMCVLPQDTGCHESVVRFLTETGSAHPSRFHVQFKGIHEFSESELARTVGEVCAAVIINGNVTFRIQDEGGEHDVTLIGTVPTHYGIPDIAAALQHVFAEVYPGVEVPPLAAAIDPADAQCVRPSPQPADDLEPVEDLPAFMPLDTDGAE